MTNKEEKTEIETNYAYDIPSNKDYTFDEFFTNTNENELKWINSKRPENVKIWNQGNTPACTCYSATHIFNGNNILEDSVDWTSREQQDPIVFWNKFCTDRNNFNSGTSIQTMANWFKNNKYIQWYVTIWVKEKDKIAKMKKALDGWFFLSTGSSFGDWSKIKQTGIYSEREDRKFVWHAWAIVDYWDGFFRGVNSYGDKRGKYNGMFKVPFDMVDKIYSCLVFIDKDDTWTLNELKTKKKVEELLTIAKQLYNSANDTQKKYFEQIMLSKRLKELYSL